MDYEKLYKRVIEIAIEIYNTPCKPERAAIVKELIEQIFPELKESEDEKIRKCIEDLIKENTFSNIYGVTKDDCLAWLEKQGDTDKTSYEIAEKEKQEFVGDGFIKCYADFQDFKEGETYWLEYIGNDNYNVRSDNLLGKTYHITPCQLYTIFKKMTWLEKQGEQKSFDYEHANIQQKDFASIEPKFHEGDILKHNNSNVICKVLSVNVGFYRLMNILGGDEMELSNVEKNFHLWSIEDAKPGDVLVTKEDERPFLFKGLDNRFPQLPVAYCGINVKNDFKICSLNSWWTDETVYPATEKQRAMLFSKMKEAGYEWDANKKELKEIEQKSTNWFEGEKIIYDAIKEVCNIEDSLDAIAFAKHNETVFDVAKRVIEKVGEQKSTWREEDEEFFNDTIAFLEIQKNALVHVDWIKSLKERIKGER